MIVVRITMQVVPENQLEVVQTLLSLIAPAGKEEGCLSYGVFCNIEDKNSFGLLQEWKTRKDFDRHLMSHRFGVLLGTKSLLSEPPEIHIHTIARSEGMEAIHAVRSKSN